MPELSVLILTTDEDQRTLLPVLVDGTAIAKTVNTIFGFPLGTTDPVVRRIKESHADVVLRRLALRSWNQPVWASQFLPTWTMRPSGNGESTSASAPALAPIPLKMWTN